MNSRVAALALSAALTISAALALQACSSDSSTDSTTTSSPTAPQTAPQTSPAPTVPATTAAPTSTEPVAPTTTLPASITIRCDADSKENPSFDVPLGTEVTLIASSTKRREFHLHGYDIELTGNEVTFQFTADIPGPHELTEHPDHTTVCTIIS